MMPRAHLVHARRAARQDPADPLGQGVRRVGQELRVAQRPRLERLGRTNQIAQAPALRRVAAHDERRGRAGEHGDRREQSDQGDGELGGHR
jgi:hypothetical protein